MVHDVFYFSSVVVAVGVLLVVVFSCCCCWGGGIGLFCLFALFICLFFVVVVFTLLS